MEQIIHLLANGEEVIDVDEESFLLFAQDIPSNNLGMLNPRAPSVEISINGNEYTIHQSPSLLSSHRAGGTTGAGKYGIQYGVHHIGARMICTSSFMICPRNPQRPSTDFSAGLLPESEAPRPGPRVQGVECSSRPIRCLSVPRLSEDECLI